jgi:hypothetical protein
LPQGVYQPEDAAAIVPDEIGELFPRDRVRRSRDGFENRQPAVEALNGGSVVHGFSVHGVGL